MKQGTQRQATHAKRGSILLAAMLLMMVLTGLAAIGARNVIIAFSLSGNHRTGDIALKVTEAGVDSVMALAVTKGDAFHSYVQANLNQLAMNDVSGTFFDLKKDGSFGREYCLGTTDCQAKTGGVDFVNVLSLPQATNRVPGYPVSEDFIWNKYKITTSGFYGNQTVVTPADTIRNAARQYVSYIYVGPYIVGGN